MSTFLLSVGTAVPPARLDQARTRDFFAAQPGVDRLTSRLIGAAFDQSAIASRYSVIGEIGSRSTRFSDDGARLRAPSTGERNALYRAEAPGLYAAASREALARAGVDAAEVTHVVTASCTGFFAPGPDFLLVKELGIPRTAPRVHVGFMGCAAAFPALRTAASICRAEPGAVVLVACAELCSLHIRSSRDPEQIVASAVFGDGAGAAVVSSTPPRGGRAALEVGGFSTALTSEGEHDMDWTIGDSGFEMRLTAEVPRIIGREIAGVVAEMLGAANPQSTEMAWAVHPGGRSVLDRVQDGVGLEEAAMAHSRAVLRDFGNMSSATILFILQRILADASLAGGAPVAGLCFGPGLTVETARLSVHDGSREPARAVVAAGRTRRPADGEDARPSGAADPGDAAAVPGAPIGRDAAGATATAAAPDRAVETAAPVAG
ncbi:type III polyketide synthase [Leucobacter allii]|uniref:type III polyketide synthase n=1 Tax=Leucobacter allii TaxID=2932247 RepID=UPI001FD4C186|nr:type III polyketide synthase [Leucobacter allii]UOR00382.1 type III polyketide synthase [Leucobacter allii]